MMIVYTDSNDNIYGPSQKGCRSIRLEVGAEIDFVPHTKTLPVP